MSALDADVADTAPTARTINPNLPPAVMRKLLAYIEVKAGSGQRDLVDGLRRLHELWQDERWSLELRGVALLVADLIDQGWEVSTAGDALHLQPPGLRVAGESTEDAKQRLRRALQMGRDRQLRDPAVVKFVQRMHRPVRRGAVTSSIIDLIDNGAELAALLKDMRDQPPSVAAEALKAVVDPVVEVCDEDAKCTTTGLRLIDIWRYFRHTWSLEYRSIPGRQLAFLIRNAARPRRPVIGIGMLASPVVALRVRDKWMGWTPEAFIERMRDGRLDVEVALRALVARIERNIADIRWDDLTTADEIAFPTERAVLRLEQRSAGAAVARIRELGDRYQQAEELEEDVQSQRTAASRTNAAIDWLAESDDVLFVRKRAETLASLLNAKRTFQILDWSKSGNDLLNEMLGHPNGLRTLSTALKEVRKVGLSSQVADVSVCGAVAPYNVLLGGKLVALLMTSQEVRDAYRKRYGSQISIISSQMAGRAIYRSAELKVLTTTSLYGNGSSQYNRLRLAARDFPELTDDLEWLEIKKTAGYGSVHLSNTTVRVLREFSERTLRARQVNHRFGEGSSPRLRQIRQAVDMLGIDSGAVLNHATPRVFYACELHQGALDELLGIKPTTASVGYSAAILTSLWRQRWLSKRISSAGVLDRLAQAGPHSIHSIFAKSDIGHTADLFETLGAMANGVSDSLQDKESA